jgi:hypothetical protein
MIKLALTVLNFAKKTPLKLVEAPKNFLGRWEVAALDGNPASCSHAPAIGHQTIIYARPDG